MRLRHTGGSLTLGMVLWAGAVVALGAVAQQIPFEDVIANLKAALPSNRAQALRMLRQSGYLESALPIVPLLADPAKEVQFDAIDTELSLFLVDEAFTREIGGAIVGKGDSSLALLAFAEGAGATIANPVPPSVMAGLVGALRSPATEARFEAAYALGVLGPPAVRAGAFREGRASIERLLALMQDSEPAVRLAATHVAARLMGTALRYPDRNRDTLDFRQTVGDQCVVGINDPDPLRRLASIKALGELKHERGLQALSDQFAYYKRGEVALAALDAIARTAHRSSMALLTSLLASRDEQVRVLAVDGIARTSDRIAIGAAENRLAGDRSSRVALALTFARYRSVGASQIGPIVDALRSGALGGKPLQIQAWNYLLELGPDNVPSLLPFMQHNDAGVRAMIAELLGILGDARALPALDAAMQDSSKSVSAAAGRSIKRLRARPAGVGRI
jgi:HEAT repeat protein